MNDPSLTASFVIPSLNGEDENLNRLRQVIQRAGFPDDQYEILSAVGVSPNGRARDRGAIETNGEYLVFLDDDVTFADPEDLRRIVHFLDSHEEVGLCGPAQQMPPDLSGRERVRGGQMPRTHVEVPDQFVESDMVTHACLCIPRDLFFEVGMEHPNLISGTDPDLRQKVRRAGYKVGIVPDTRVFHPPLSTWKQALNKNFTGGRRSRAVRREYPSYHFSAEPDQTDVEEPDGNSFQERIGRHLRQLGTRVLGGKFFALSSQIAYQLGHLYEKLFPKQWVDPIPYPNPPHPDQPDWDRFLEALGEQGHVEWLYRPRNQTDSS